MHVRFAAKYLAILAASALLSGCFNAPDDAELLKLFKDNRSKFETLVDMMEEDSATCAQARMTDDCGGRINVWGAGSQDYLSISYTVGIDIGPKDTLTIDRLEQYILRTKSIPLKETDLRWGRGGAQIEVYASNFLISQWRVYLVFRPQDPTPLVESLDGWASVWLVSENIAAYRRIDDDWYLLAVYHSAMP